MGRRTTLEVDDVLLRQAQGALGTKGLKDTVDKAFREVIRRRLRGRLAQRIDAGTTLTAAALTKTGTGNLNLAGSAIDLNGTVDVNAGSLTIENAFSAAGNLLASVNVSLAGAGTLDGVAGQRVDAEGGTLVSLALTKTGAGNLTLAGDTLIDLLVADRD